MILSPEKKRYLIIGGSILLVLATLLISANFLLRHFIKKELNAALTNKNFSLYHLSIDKIHTNIMFGNIRVSNIKLSPDSTVLANARKEEYTSPLLFEINLKELRFKRFNLITALLQKKIDIGKIVLKQANITIFSGEKNQNPQTQTDVLLLNSLRIKGISGIDLEKIVFKQTNCTFIDLLSSDTIFSTSANKTELKHLILTKSNENSDLFQLNRENLLLEIIDEQLFLPEGNYCLAVKRLIFSVKNKEVRLTGTNLSPRNADVYKLARKLHYTTEIFNIDVGAIQLKNIDLLKCISTQSIFIDSLKVSELDLSIFMDKRLPFNTERRPKLPHQLLKNIDFPLHIGVLQIKNSNLLYQEKMPDVKAPLTVTLDNLNVDIKRITSVKDSLYVHQNMTIRLKADFMNKAQMRINFAFPLYFDADTFFYTGSLHSADFSIFNKATLPAINAKFIAGELKNIQFKGWANTQINTGELTMLYDNLKTEISRKDLTGKSKVMSFAANTVLLNSNPGNNGKTRVAQMHSERVPYKGFGNFMWKTLQDGITNTVLTTGNTEKMDTSDKRKKKRK